MTHASSTHCAQRHVRLGRGASGHWSVPSAPRTKMFGYDRYDADRNVMVDECGTPAQAASGAPVPEPIGPGVRVYHLCGTNEGLG